MIQMLIHTDAGFELILWNIDAEGSGDAVIGRISMMCIPMQIDVVVR